MLESIRKAQSQILLEMYLVESGVLLDQFIDVLTDAARRHVGVYLLFDDFGSRGLHARDRQRITTAGIHLLSYNPLRFGHLRRNLLRDHRKLLVVDGRQAFVSGVGLTDVFDVDSHPEDFWHDVAVQIEGPVVADWLLLFRRNWWRWARHRVFPGKIETTGVPAEGSDGGQAGRVVAGPRFGRRSIHRSFVQHVRQAERRVWMVTAYFVPSRSLLRALRRAARRGLDVRLLLPGSKTDHPAVRYAGHQYYYSLLRAGVRIFEYQPRFVHAKILLCDDWVSLGSSNLDRWNLLWNLEANQEIENSEFALRVCELFVADFANSKECQFDAWQVRPTYRRALEWFWGRVAQWLEKISIHTRRNKK